MKPDFASMPLPARRQAFLDYTASHYNLGNRSVSPESFWGQCFYAPTPTSIGCAIGQHAPATHGKEGAVIQADIFPLLPEWMQEMGKPFLHEVQKLHDTESNWTETGLSEAGGQTVQHIKLSYLGNPWNTIQ